MLRTFRWLLRLTVGLIALSVLAAALVWYFALRSLPDYNATYRAEALSAPVEIVRSTENVPHIFAQNDADAYFALGLAHAQDRLFQMVTLRRAAQGTLAEIYGERAIEADDLARRLELYRNANASVAAQDAATSAALSAYAAGVNRWIEIVNENALGRGAPEFFLLPDQMAYWRPADSLAIWKLYAASVSDQLEAEILRARLSVAEPRRGNDLVAMLGEPALPDYAGLFGGARLPAPERSTSTDWDSGLAGFMLPFRGGAGNLFAAAPERTAAGGALLAADPQMPLTAPGLFYLARLSLGSGDVIGATLPGTPAMLTGRSAGLAWGIAPAGIDDADLLIEEVQPGDATRYRGLNGWDGFETRREILGVRDAPGRTLALHRTANGPLIGAYPGAGSITPPGHVAALSWTGLSDRDSSMSALIGIMQAPDRASALRAAEAMVAPAVTLTLADHDGIAQEIIGHIPQRAQNHQTRGRMPAPGWRAENRWLGTGPAPRGLNPPSEDGLAHATGAVRAAQNLGFSGDEPLRGERLGRLLAGREIHTRDSFIENQLDIVSAAARALLPIVGADLWFTDEPAAPGTTERQRQDALSLLAEWDGAMNEHLPEPLIYTAWMAALQDRLIRDELGPLADDITHVSPVFIERVFRNRGGAAEWCDIRQSAPVETCPMIARQALDAAILDLTARFGPDVTSWRWGDLHEAVQTHPYIGLLPRFGWMANIRQSMSGGDFTLARAGTIGTGPNPFRGVTGAGYRGIYDLADPDSSVFIISTGQSGHPFSRHYDDLSIRWRRGEYIGMSLDPDLARAASVGVTRLIPQGPAQEVSR
ncbi:MAG: penicillin acylase family protein [Paracoccus sp. (in: a-proteobacteria)]|nr:penicillin acylase family protein [Paracoccus sp. (in: a-proteobacteria)]